MPDHPPTQDVTGLLQQWRAGNADALERLLPLVYEELRGVGRGGLRQEQPGHTLQATALVHEAYLRLIGSRTLTPQNRAHLFAVAARLMREILVDHARRRHALKRGGDVTVLGLDGVDAGVENNVVEVLALDEALMELASLDPRVGRVVEMRFFAGLTIAETADALDVSPATVERDCAVAKAWMV